VAGFGHLSGDPVTTVIGKHRRLPLPTTSPRWRLLAHVDCLRVADNLSKREYLLRFLSFEVAHAAGFRALVRQLAWVGSHTTLFFIKSFMRVRARGFSAGMVAD
jgi:hypothetical protein